MALVALLTLVAVLGGAAVVASKKTPTKRAGNNRTKRGRRTTGKTPFKAPPQRRTTNTATRTRVSDPVAKNLSFSWLQPSTWFSSEREKGAEKSHVEHLQKAREQRQQQSSGG
jgi:hypothetical protein